MSQTGLEYYSGNVPGGIFLLIGLLAVTWFVLWFVYFNSKILRRNRFFIIGIICSLSLCVGYVYLWNKYPPPHERERIIIIPNASPGFTESFSQIYLHQTYLYEFLKSKIDLSRFLVYKPDWTLSVASWDSLKFYSYQVKLGAFMHAQYIFLIDYNEPDQQISGDLLVKTKTGFDTFKAALVGSSDALEVNREVLELFSIDPNQTRIITSRWSKQAQNFWVKGKLASILKDVSTARKSFEQSLRVQEDFYLAKIELAQIEVDSAQIIQANGGYFQNHLARAIQYLHQLRDQDVINADAARIWGEHAILLENFVVAEQKLKESFQLDRFNDRVYLDLAQLHPSRYQKLKFLNEESLIRQALFVNPTSIQARILFSDYLNLNSRYEECENNMLEFLTNFPDQFDILLELGKFYISRQNYIKAQSIFTKMLRGSYPDKMPVEFNLGIVHFHKDDFMNAKKFFSKIANENTNPDAFLYLATISEKEGDLEQSIEYLRKRIRNNSGPNDRFKEEARKRLVLLLRKQEELSN